MTALKWTGVGVATLAAGLIVSAGMGSAPDAPAGGPLAACGPNPNCARVRVTIAAPPETVRAAAREALVETGATAIDATEAGWNAAAPIGPFVDDVAVALEADGAGSVLWIRSASRVGRSDLGVNARRARRLAEATDRIAAG